MTFRGGTPANHAFVSHSRDGFVAVAFPRQLPDPRVDGRNGIAGAVVVHDHAIEAYLVLAAGAEASAVETEITTRLAAYKRPRRLHVVEQLPRTATGKLVRNQAVLRDIGAEQASAPRHKAGQAGDGARSRRPG